jgi:hypothetical protein
MPSSYADDTPMQPTEDTLNSRLTNLVQVVLPIAFAVGVPPLLLGWALIQVASFLR